MSSTAIMSPPRSGCPISSSLDVLGDRWTLIIVRDLINGKSKFGDFLSSPERITTNILSDRLRKMEQHELIRATRYLDHPPRYQYQLTPKGMALLPVLQEFCLWANEWIPNTWIPPEDFMSRGKGS